MIKTKEFFISYAHEDVHIANALASTLQQIDDTFVVVNMDKMSLESGINFRTQLQDKLQRSEVLFVVHTDVAKAAFGYTGWEVGYFEGVHKNDASPIISVHLSVPPATLSDRQGISLNINPDDLRLDTDRFEARLTADINKSHPLVRFMDEKRMDLGVSRRDAQINPSRELDTEAAVREMVLKIFEERKNAPDATIKPQKQIVIRTAKNQLEAAEGELPNDAQLIPVGAGAPMSVFGLTERPISWECFCGAVTTHALGTSWIQAIKAVVASSSPSQINVDNSQIILSPDNHIYRVILTTSTAYFNGKLEINLYLVEALKRPDYGDKTTTYLLKGLELASRFRFLFLERDSRFYSCNLKLLPLDQIRKAAREVVAELNILSRDALEAGLHEPSVWGGLVNWELLGKINELWGPFDADVRRLCAAISATTAPSSLDELRQRLVASVQSLEEAIRPHNTELIVEMAERLQQVIKQGEPHYLACPISAEVATDQGRRAQTTTAAMV